MVTVQVYTVNGQEMYYNGNVVNRALKGGMHHHKLLGQIKLTEILFTIKKNM